MSLAQFTARRQARLALIQEHGGSTADFKAVAREALRRGLYSPTTNRGDIELTLRKTWLRRNRH